MLDKVGKIREFFKDPTNTHRFFLWIFMLAITMMLVRNTFFDNTRWKHTRDNNDQYVKDIVVIDYKITMLNKKDSTLTFIRNEKHEQIDSMSADELAAYIRSAISHE